MLGLLVASVWSWAIIFDKVTRYAAFRRQLNQFESNFWSGQSLEELYHTLSDRKTTGMGALFVAAMREWKKSFEKGARSPIGLQTRIEKAMEGDFETGNLRYKKRERYAFGFTDPRGAVGSQGA